jgi:hypothetical protein
LTSYPSSPLTIYVDVPGLPQVGHFNPIFIEKINYEDTVLLAGKLYVTNKERTICDLINGNSNEEYIYEAIETYLDTGSAESLFAYAEKYKCVDSMRHYIATLDDYIANLI